MHTAQSLFFFFWYYFSFASTIIITIIIILYHRNPHQHAYAFVRQINHIRLLERAQTFVRSYGIRILFRYFYFSFLFARVKELPCVGIDERPPTFSTHMLLPFSLSLSPFSSFFTSYVLDMHVIIKRTISSLLILGLFLYFFFLRTVIRRPSFRNISIRKVSSRGCSHLLI